MRFDESGESTSDSPDTTVRSGRRVMAWTSASLLFIAAVSTALTATLFSPWAHYLPDLVGHWLQGVMFAVAAAVLIRQPEQSRTAVAVAGLAAVITFSAVCHYLLIDLAAVGYLIAALNPALGVLVLLRFPENHTLWWRGAFAGVCAIALLVVAIGIMLTADPAWIRWPSQAPWPGQPDRAAFDRWTDVKSIVYGVLGVAFVGFYIQRWIGLGRLERRILRPVLWAALATAIAYISRSPAQAAGGVWTDLSHNVRQFAPTLLAVAFLVSAIRVGLSKGVLSGLISRLSGPVELAEVRSALRTALSDPTLDIFYWLPDQERFVDSAGRDVTIDSNTGQDRWIRPAHSHDGQHLVAAVSLDARLRRQRDLVDSAITISRLALENARLQADLQAQLTAAHEARARLMHAGLEQRRQLERDLHDGAQSRLLSLSLRLGALRHATTDTHTASELAALQHEIRAALAELRDLAHGLYPALLSQAGLAAAVQAIADRTPLTVRHNIPAQRWNPDVESAAYLVVSEGLTNVMKHAGPCEVDIGVTQTDHHLTIHLHDTGHGDPTLNQPRSLPTLRDRVEALGGRIHVESNDQAGTTLIAQLPC